MLKKLLYALVLAPGLYGSAQAQPAAAPTYKVMDIACYGGQTWKVTANPKCYTLPDWYVKAERKCEGGCQKFKRPDGSFRTKCGVQTFRVTRRCN